MLPRALRGPAGNGAWALRLLLEADHAEVLVDLHHAELSGGLLDRYLDAAHGHFGAAVDVLVEHAGVVHLVDVVAGEHQHEARRVAAQHLEVLVHRVGGALVPVAIVTLLRGQELDELVEAPVEERPSLLHVVDEPVGMILRRHADPADAGVYAVGEREVDDAELAAEGHRGLRAAGGERAQARAAPAGEDHRDRLARELRHGRAVRQPRAPRRGAPEGSSAARSSCAPSAGLSRRSRLSEASWIRPGAMREISAVRRCSLAPDDGRSRSGAP